MGIILEYADCSLGALLHEEKYEQRKYHLGKALNCLNEKVVFAIIYSFL